MLRLLPASLMSVVVSLLLAAGGHGAPATLVAATAAASASLAWAATQLPIVHRRENTSEIE